MAGASAAVSFSGTGIDWRTVAGPDQGEAKVFVDGVLQLEVDNRAETRSAVVRSIIGLAPGTHTLRIVVVGGDAASFVSVDGFTVRP